ncbi:MAG: 4Fe-4S ferredoxin [Candidatus Heimdallarchaeota archaeon]
MSTINPSNFMSTNVGSERLRASRKILLFGECIRTEHRTIFDHFMREHDLVPLETCLETEHIGKIQNKLATMIKVSKIQEITVLTADGSPHCVQLHYAVREVQRHFAPDLKVNHYVIENGKLIKIDPRAVTISRHLSRIQKYLDRLY